MKTPLILLFTGILLITGCSSVKNELSYKKDQFDAINDFLDSVVVDKDKEIIIIKEKINPTMTLEIFEGYPNENNPTESRTVGINFPYYNENNFKIMKDKYGGGIRYTPEKELLENTFWSAKDFKLRKINFKNSEFYYYATRLGNSCNDNPFLNKNVFFLSEPIYYRQNEFVTFSVEHSEVNGVFRVFVVLMKKKKDKWGVVNIAEPPWYN